MERLAAQQPLTQSWTLFLGFLFLQALLSVGEAPALSWVLIPVLKQTLGLAVFLALLFVPALVIFSNLAAGEGFNWRVHPRVYRQHVAVLFLLWGAAGLICLVLKQLIPPAFVLYPVLVAVYTLFALRTLNYLTVAQTLLAFACSLPTLPLALVALNFTLSLPFFLLLFLIFLGARRAMEVLGQGEQATQHQRYLQTLTVNPNDADAHFQIGLIHLEKRDLAKARTSFAQAVEIDPEEVEYHYYLGLVETSLGRFQSAFEQLEKVYHQDPNYKFGELKRELGKIYLSTEHYQEAIRFLTEYLQERSSDAEARYWLACAHLKAEDLEQAVEQLDTLLNADPHLRPFQLREARKWRRSGRKLLSRIRSAAST